MLPHSSNILPVLFVNIFVLLLVPRLSFQLPVTTLLLHRGHGGTTPEGEEAETKFATGLGIDGCPAKFDKQAIGIVKTKYEEMKSVNLDVGFATWNTKALQ